MLSPQQLKAMKLAKSVGNGDDDILLTSPKGNTLKKSEWDMISKKGVWSDPQEYMNYVDGWAKPNATVQTPDTPMVGFGMGTGRVNVPAQDFINYMSNPNVNNKTYATKPFDLSDPSKIQQQLDQYQRVDGTGLEGVFQGIQKGLQKPKQEIKGKKSLPLDPK